MPKSASSAHCWGASASPATLRARTPARFQVARRRSWRSRSWSRASTTCSCSTRRPTTHTPPPPSPPGVALALAEWPGTMIIVSHDPEFVESLKPGRVLFMPEGRLDYWEEDLLDVVSLA